MISNVSTPSSTPPGARGSARTVPVTRTDDSCVTCSTLLQVSSETSFLKTTHCRYPLPSRMIGNCSFPEVRLLYNQPLTVTFSPTCCANSLIRTVVIRAGIIPTPATAAGRRRASRRDGGAPERRRPAGWPGAVPAPSPHPLPITQSRLRRVASNISSRRVVIARTPDHPIEVLPLPDHTPTDHVRRVRLPRMNHTRQLATLRKMQHDVHVIRHHAPRVQFVTHAIEMP